MHVRRTSLALALSLAAALLLPTTSHAQARAPASSMRGAVLVGFEEINDMGGIALRFDGEFHQKVLSPVARLSLVGSLGFSHVADDETDFFGDSYEWSLNVFRFVPAARITFGRTQAAGLYLDGGLGLYHARVNVEYTEAGTGFTADADDSETSIVMRLAAGGFFQLSPGLRLGAELGLNPFFGDVDETSFTALASLSFRM